MKNFILFTLILSLASCSKKEVKDVPQSTQVEKKVVIANAEYNFAIEGMVCEQGCSKRIERVLNDTPGVEKATISFEDEKALVSYDSVQISKTQINTLVEELGEYKVLQ